MVKSSRINAFVMENRVFDQSIVGIFPKDESKFLYLLGFMNSETANKIIHLINPTANNSSNYIKQIPYKEPDKKTYEKICNLVSVALKSAKNNEIEKNLAVQKELDFIFNMIYAA